MFGVLGLNKRGVTKVLRVMSRWPSIKFLKISTQQLVCKKNGEDYEPDSLRIMVTAMDHYLADKGYKYSIICGREFQSSKQILEGKARMLEQQGKGKRRTKLEV